MEMKQREMPQQDKKPFFSLHKTEETGEKGTFGRFFGWFRGGTSAEKLHTQTVQKETSATRNIHTDTSGTASPATVLIAAGAVMTLVGIAGMLISGTDSALLLSLTGSSQNLWVLQLGIFVASAWLTIMGVLGFRAAWQSRKK